MRVLLLGGTSEARALAAMLEPDPAFHVVSSLAGRVTDPALPVGEYVIGGFGGVDGLVAFLRERAIDAVVDATHPFARTMSANAVSACQASAVALLALRRPGWDEVPGDRWHRVASVAAAAAVARDLTEPDACVFVTTGRQELVPFADDRERHYLIRSVDPPATALPPRHTLLLDRGPYDVAGELALLREHEVATLVTKDSGGPMTYPKIVAARDLGIPVVIVGRPVLPDTGEVPVETPQEALDWLRRRGAAPDPER